MPWLQPDDASLVVDLYELTMAASYFTHGLVGEATFDLFVRRLPQQRNFLIACGLDDALDALQDWHFSRRSLDYLAGLGLFDTAFLSYLEGLRFMGSVRAIDEGETVFANEPLLSVTAPLIQAQLVETLLLNVVTFQTMVASKAARIAIACRDRDFVDFGARRMHGSDAVLRAPRAAYIGGANATSSVLAGREYGIPVNGTMAHSYVQAFPDEEAAFRAYAGDFPGRTTLLLDTYDSIAAAHTVVKLSREVSGIQAVRLDSGDLEGLSLRVRAILDAGGCHDIRIVASGDLDEYRIDELLARGAPIDSFGVGTALGTSSDAPNLSGVYKLVEFAGSGRRKLAPGKETLPGRKQVYRIEQGEDSYDLLVREDERLVMERPLLREVMAQGRRLQPRRPLEAIRRQRADAVASLPAGLLCLGPAAKPYQVRLSASMARAARAGPA